MDHLREIRDEYVATTARPWPEPGQWTYADYARLPDDNWKYEVIEGVLYMTPSPNTKHQRIIFRLLLHLGQFVLQHKTGELLPAPYDVILPDDLGTPVQPDILFVRQDRRHIVGAKNTQGVPDLMIEVLSPSNWEDDRKVKFDVYARAGVPEYWIVDPLAETVEVFVLQEDAYTLLGRFTQDDTVQSQVFDGLTLPAGEVFAP
ncbi:Uma2 family endonuclease [bacterium]|nr:Uma2 family endonuclease [bacterium]